MSALLDPEELGLTHCAGCGHEFRDADPYFRGATACPAGVLLYILCRPCAEKLRHDPVAAENFSAQAGDKVLAEMPARGRA